MAEEEIRICTQLVHSGLQAMKEHSAERISNYCYVVASQIGKLDIIRWLHEEKRVRFNNSVIPFDFICHHAAQYGHLHIIKYLHEQGCPWGTETCIQAAKNGHLSCLQYAVDNGCPVNEDACFEAAANGHLDCLQYAVENGCPVNEDACFATAAHGHLDCLQYLVQMGIPLHRQITYETSFNGHLGCLQYAIEHGCEIHEDSIYVAAWQNHMDCFSYLYKILVSSKRDQEFWSNPFGKLFNHPPVPYDYSDSFIEQFHLDDHMWRLGLFTTDLSGHPKLQTRVDAKKQELLEIKVGIIQALSDSCTKDVMEHVICPYV